MPSMVELDDRGWVKTRLAANKDLLSHSLHHLKTLLRCNCKCIILLKLQGPVHQIDQANF